MKKNDSTPNLNPSAPPGSLQFSGKVNRATTTDGTTSELHVSAGVSPFVSPDVAHHWEQVAPGSAKHLIEYTLKEQDNRNKIELLREERETEAMRLYYSSQDNEAQRRSNSHHLGMKLAFCGWVLTIALSAYLFQLGTVPAVITGSVLGGFFTVAIIKAFLLQAKKAHGENGEVTADDVENIDFENMTDEQCEMLESITKNHRKRQALPHDTSTP